MPLPEDYPPDNYPMQIGDIVQPEDVRAIYETLGPDPVGPAANVGARISSVEVAASTSTSALVLVNARMAEIEVLLEDGIEADQGPPGPPGTNGTNGVGFVILAVGEAIDPSLPIGTVVLRETT